MATDITTTDITTTDITTTRAVEVQQGGADPPAVVVVAITRQQLGVDLDAVFPPEETTSIVLTDDVTGSVVAPGTPPPPTTVVAHRPRWATAIDDLTASRRDRVEVVTNDEYCLRYVADLRARLGLARRHPSALECYLDKAVMKSVLRDAGVPVTPFAVIDPVPDPDAARDLMAHLGPVVVLKPRAEANSRGITVATSTNRLERWLAEHAGEPGWLAERYLTARAHHANAVIAYGAVHDVQVGTYITSLLDLEQGLPIGSYTLPSDHPVAQTARALTRRVVDALGHDGVFVVHLEFFLDDPGRPADDAAASCSLGEPVVLEVAARAPGGLVSAMAQVSTGVDLQRAHLRLQAGLPQHVNPRPRPLHAAWLWFPRAADRATTPFRPPTLVSDHRINLTPNAPPFSDAGLAVGAGLLMWNSDPEALAHDISHARTAKVWW